MECEHRFLNTTWSKVCCLCGYTERVLYLDQFNTNSAPLYKGYNRRTRFTLKVNKLLGIHSGPNSEDPIWPYLAKRSLFLNSPLDIRNCLRNAPLRNKHYDCVRIFCDVFTDFKVSIDPQSTYQLQQYLFKQFETLYCRWNALRNSPFFSYAWLLRRFLTDIYSPLIVYLKPRTCKRRNIKYETLLQSLTQSPNNDEIQNCRALGTRLRNMKVHSNYHLG